MDAKNIIQEKITDLYSHYGSSRSSIEDMNHTLTVFFIKFVTVVDHLALSEEANQDTSLVTVTLPKDSDFDYLYSKRDLTNLGSLIDEALSKIQDANPNQLENVFRFVNFERYFQLGESAKRTEYIYNLFGLLHSLESEFRHIAKTRISEFGAAFESLISIFVSRLRNTRVDIYSPREVSILIAELITPKCGESIFDPACGTGSLLTKMARSTAYQQPSLYGQEVDASTYAICKLNMLCHSYNAAQIHLGDTIQSPGFLHNEDLMNFDIVVSVPPFSSKGLNDYHDKYHRFRRGTPPARRADYAFLSHMIESAKKDTGRVAVVVTVGVLFRKGIENQIRKSLVEENLIEAVIQLPRQLFHHSTIPTALLILNKKRRGWEKATDTRDSHVLFIDASRGYQETGGQNRLRAEDIERIVSTYRDYAEVASYSNLSNLSDIEKTNFDLTVEHYVRAADVAKATDLTQLVNKIETLESELTATQRELNEHLARNFL